ncbi:hypothetical protein [Kutzneria buriramensis]|uniref:Uncharacterized protein n=1 Tax=Kutzneria buriramensis TaxID=1045776 RepID=A0A3E0GU13_9PSEU|nr:hypothetical protein [Kutzneria buriramensis]REH27699.1 hypothetical protein BCF44_1282 [Kutzneria buriramensis]
MKGSLAVMMMTAVVILSLLAGGPVANAAQPHGAVLSVSTTFVFGQIGTRGPNGSD